MTVRLNYNNNTFEEIKHIDENGIEYWYARELQTVLDYKEWRKFEGVIKRAMESCKNSNINTFEHFVGTDKLSKRANNADDIAKRKELRYREDILDNMGSDELIANLFRISQTEQKLKRDNINSENEANSTHYNVGKIVRNAIKEAGRNNARKSTYT